MPSTGIDSGGVCSLQQSEVHQYAAQPYLFVGGGALPVRRDPPALLSPWLPLLWGCLPAPLPSALPPVLPL